MEQIQIRQPKMPVAQSFIQNLETFLAMRFYSLLFYNFTFKRIQKPIEIAKSIAAITFSYKKINSFFIKKYIEI